jgi:hypothetical protein
MRRREFIAGLGGAVSYRPDGFMIASVGNVVIDVRQGVCGDVYP